MTFWNHPTGARRRAIALTLLGGLALAAPAGGEEPARPARNVILMVADGCGLEHFTLARWFKGAPLTLDEIRTGSLRTHIVGSIVGESAAASTALAAGQLTRAKQLGLAPVPAGDPNDGPKTSRKMWPFASLVEAARLDGRSVGLVVTSSFTHATPAGFYAHVSGRDNHDTIAIQGLHAGMNVVLGGGSGYLRPTADGGLREDGQDLSADLEDTGCDIVGTADEMQAARGNCLWGLFAEDSMTAMVDRPRFGGGEPTLAEMTRKAIDVLARNPSGFFLMVEGSQIDWASHANDGGYLVRELLAYDEAVEVALDFARRDERTLLLSISDHTTGGLSILGRKEKGRGAVDAVVDPLRGMQCAAFRFVDRLQPDPLRASARQIQDVVAEGWGLDISRAEARQIRRVMRRIKKKDNRKYAFGEVLSRKHVGIAWTTHDHDGGDVPLHAFGPGRPTGTLEMRDIARLCAGTLALDLGQTTGRLFVELREVFGTNAVAIRTDGSGRRTVVVALDDGTVAELALDAAHLTLAGKDHPLEGIVFAVDGGDRLYAPRQAVELIREYQAAHP